MQSQHDLIDRYVAAGWKLIPVKDKIPLVQEWTKLDITPELVNSWRSKFTSCDWGVVLKDFVVFDCDGEGAEKQYQTLGLPETLTCKTKRGFHHYFRCKNVRNAQDILGTRSNGYQIDIRGNGGYCVIPPTEGYSWLNRVSIKQIDEDAANKIRSNGSGNSEGPGSRVRDEAFYKEKWEGITEGDGRHQEALSKIGELVARKHPIQQVYALIEMWNKTNEPPLEEDWLKQKIEECWNKDVAKVQTEFGLSKGVSEFCKYLQNKVSNPEPIIRTGFTKLDSLIWGLNAGELHVVMADSNVGKTALSLYMGYYNARRGKRVLYFSTESSRNSIMARLFAIFYPIRATAFRTGNFTTEETKVLRQAIQEFKQINFDICDVPTPSIKNVRQLTEQLHPDLVFVDYFQRCWFENESWVEYKNFAVGMKDIARLHNIPVVLTSQVHQHKIADFKSGKMKKLEVESGDIRSSKALKHEADIIIVLNERINKLSDKFVKVTVDKARDADRGSMYTKFVKEHLRFEEISEQDFTASTTEQEE